MCPRTPSRDHTQQGQSFPALQPQNPHPAPEDEQQEELGWAVHRSQSQGLTSEPSPGSGGLRKEREEPGPNSISQSGEACPEPVEETPGSAHTRGCLWGQTELSANHPALPQDKTNKTTQAPAHLQEVVPQLSSCR